MSDISFWGSTPKAEKLKSNLQHKLKIVLPKINEYDGDINGTFMMQTIFRINRI